MLSGKVSHPRKPCRYWFIWQGWQDLNPQPTLLEFCLVSNREHPLIFAISTVTGFPGFRTLPRHLSDCPLLPFMFAVFRRVARPEGRGAWELLLPRRHSSRIAGQTSFLHLQRGHGLRLAGPGKGKTTIGPGPRLIPQVRGPISLGGLRES